MTTLATRFCAAAAADPDGIAVIVEDRPSTFAEIAELTDRYAHGLVSHGVCQGTRIALMLPPGREFFAICYAAFKIGAVPVHVDPGMDVDNLKLCLDRAEPEVFVGIPLAHQARTTLGWADRTLRLNITDGERGDWDGPTLAKFDVPGAPFPPVDIAPEEPAIILYTTGSTGPAKGAIFTQANVNAQFETLGELFGFSPGGVDMPTLPTIAPYTVAAGMTSVIPQMDFTRPGKVDAASLIAQIERHHVTSMFGSPALIDRLGRHGEQTGVRLPSLRRVLTAAAPVSPDTLERFLRMLEPEAQLIVFYGATEALPVALIDAREILAETAARWAEGAGTCVGRPVATMQTAVMPITDEPWPTWTPQQVVTPGDVGELVVCGREVSAAYTAQPAANAHAKIADPASGQTWHRMGDAVRIDDRGRLWFQGRLGHRVQTEEATYFNEPTEAIFNQHPKVLRTALVGVGDPGAQRRVLCVEMNPGEQSSDEVRSELLELGARHAHTAGIEDLLFHEAFPVDIRHNSKIFREKLAIWATDQLGARVAALR